jgi:hypothetical protein
LGCIICKDKVIENHKLTCKKDSEILEFEDVQDLTDYYEKRIYKAEQNASHERAMRQQSERILSDSIKNIVKTAKSKKRDALEYIKRVN